MLHIYFKEQNVNDEVRQQVSTNAGKLEHSQRSSSADNSPGSDMFQDAIFCPKPYDRDELKARVGTECFIANVKDWASRRHTHR